MTDATPLQRVLGLDIFPTQMGVTIEALALIGALLAAFAIRRRRFTISGTTFVLFAAGMLMDLVAVSLPAAYAIAVDKVGAAAVVLFFFGVIRLILEAIDAVTRRGRLHFSTIFKD